MGKKVLISTIIVMLVIVLTGVGSAGVIINPIENIYSLGEDFIASLILKPASDVDDFLVVSLVCGDESVEIHREFISLNSGEERNVEINTLLGKSILGPMIGECYLSTSYGDESEISSVFELSNEIEINFELNKIKFDPGEEIIIEGSSQRTGRGVIDGFVELSVDGMDFDFSKTTSDGTFSFNLIIPSDAKSGDHLFKLRIYETDSNGEINNEGIYEEVITIIPALKEFEIVLENNNVFPGETIDYKIMALDQAGDEIEEDVSLTIYEPGDFIFYESIIISGKENLLEIKKDFLPGYWKIETSSSDGSLIERKLFYLEELMEVKTSLIGDVLIVTNTGNVEFDGPIEIFIGSTSFVEQVVLGVGESREFKLYAPDGDYSIKINDGMEERDYGSVSLTGNVIGVKDVSGGISDSLSNPMVWGLIAMLFILFALYILSRFKAKQKDKSFIKSENKENKSSGNITSGQKEIVGIIALKSETKPGVSAGAVENALFEAKKDGGKVYGDGSHKIIMFVPSLTKKNDNESRAVKVAKKMEEILKKYNVEYGLGVHMGEIVSEIKDKQFMFTSVGNTVTQAKNITGLVKNGLLVSEDIRRKTMSDIRYDKSESGFWKINRIVR